MIALWLALTAGAIEPPEDLRPDAKMAVGCTSVRALKEMSAEGGMAEVFGKAAGQLARGTMDPDRPFWFALTDEGGEPQLTQLIFELPDGPIDPALDQKLKEQPRVSRDGRRVSVMMGDEVPPGAQSPLTDLFAAASFPGAECTFAMDRPDEDGTMRAGFALGRRRAMRMVVDTTDLASGTFGQGGDAGLVPAEGLPEGIDPSLTKRLIDELISQLREERAPRTRPWASTTATPSVAVRVNFELDVRALFDIAMEGEERDDARRALERVSLKPGSELALWQYPDGETEVAVVALVKKPRTVRWWPAKLARDAVKRGGHAERRGRLWGVAEPDRDMVWFTARRGRLMFTGDPELLADLRRKKQGSPWFQMADASAPGAVVEVVKKHRIAGRITMDGDLLVLDVPPFTTPGVQR